MSSEENSFYDDCFIIHPDDPSYFDLFGLLFSSKLGRRRFIDCPHQSNLSFVRRWIIFVSILLQKLTLSMRIPLILTRNVLEMSLNLVSWNGGLFRLPFRLMTGKLEWPHKSSAKFRSLMAFIDPRVELDDKIKPGDAKYKASLCMMSAKFSYENEAYIKTNIMEHWKMKFYEFWNDFEDHITTEVFMMQDTLSNPNLIVVAFRGTEPLQLLWNSVETVTAAPPTIQPHDLRANLDLSWYKLKHMAKGKIHSGFIKALGLQKNNGFPKELRQPTDDRRDFTYYTRRRKLRQVLHENREARFILTGHRLGGALAILFAALLMLHEEAWLLEKLEAVYTFGQPRIMKK
ncbi:triacylglycerol lipase OBL1-like [Hibiscus syriacus]|nr:triacylglycerol lipase OBL1-like [Hibiscus syriacus]